MEFAAAALSTVATAITSVATTVGGALGIGGSAAGAAGAATGTAGSLLAAGEGFGTLSLGLPSLGGAGSLFTSILSGTATVAGILGASAAGNEQARGLTAQAMDARTEQDIEALRGTDRRNSLRQSLLKTLGERDVAAAASGIDLTFGTAAMARDEAERDAESALAIDKSTEDFRVGRLKERESEFLRSAASARKAGRIKAFGLGVQGGAAIANRYA